MSQIPKTKRDAAQLMVYVGVFLAWPLWTEFKEPAQPAWNIFLGIFLVAVVAAAFLGIRRLQHGRVQVGEARFGTDKEHRGNGGQRS